MAKTQVVLIDDEVQTINMLKAFLELFNYEVTGCRTGMKGIKAVSDTNPAAVILDLMLPDVDGLEVCKTLRTSQPTRDLPILILSARSSKEEVKRGYAAGATRYLKKPLDLDQLAKELADVIELGAHKPPNEARQFEDSVKPASGLII